MYLPNLTNPIDGTPYMEIAKSFGSHDVNLRAGSMTELQNEAFGSLPLAAFAALGAAAHLQGTVPMYTKTIATTETCLTLLGLRMCGKSTGEVWCGNLGGNCLVDNAPGICSYTRTVCRVEEAEMKALLTPSNLNLKIVATLPCPAATGLPSTMT